MTSTESKRVVAIVGRPNVGKSTIFNRLAGQRIAIVHSESGVTRDRLMREIDWDGERFELIDTGGVGFADGVKHRDVIESGIRSQVDTALGDASVVVLVVDVEDGVVPMDMEMAKILRGTGCPVVVAANKCDNEARDKISAEFEELGFDVFPVSALHGRGFDDLISSVAKMLPAAAEVDDIVPLKVAVVGRPNVGKSLYINRLLQNNRVIVADHPGTTRDSIDIPFTVGAHSQARHYVLIDTAGMRRFGKVRNAVERFSHMRAEDSISRADVVVVVIDGERGLSVQDKKICSFVLKESKGCVVAVNKWDLQSRTQKQYLPEFVHDLPFMAHCPIVCMSAKTGFNIRRSVDVIDHVAGQVSRKIPTGLLNRALLGACQKVHAPSIKGKRLKVFYCTQVGHAPVRIRLFVNNPKLVKSAYRSYLIAALRRSFGLEGAPILLQFRSRREN
jgi:GTP-binding protein